MLYTSIDNEKDNVFFQGAVRELGLEGKPLTLQDMRYVYMYLQETLCL